MEASNKIFSASAYYKGLPPYSFIKSIFEVHCWVSCISEIQHLFGIIIINGFNYIISQEKYFRDILLATVKRRYCSTFRTTAV